MAEDERLGELRTAPPPAFVALRNQIAKELRAAKRKDEAAAVATLRRPGWTDWALNVVTLEHADDVARFADAARTLQEAQAAAVSGRDGPDLRESLQALRAVTADVARRADDVLRGQGRQPDTAASTTRLAEVAGHPAALAQLEAATLGTSDPGDRDALAQLLGDVSNRPAAATSTPAASRRPKLTVVDDATSKGHEKAAASEARAARRRAEREAEVEAARHEVDEARDAAGEAERQLTESTAAVSAAEDALRAARDDHAGVELRLRRATRAATDAERRLAKAERALASLGS